jgi:uncharacterized protein YceK
MMLELLTVVCFVCTGCSTLGTLSSRSIKEWPHIEMYNECNEFERFGINQKIVYSGSRNALSNIVWPFRCNGEGCWGAFVYPFTLPYSIVDLTFSAIADTVVLPYTYGIQYKECPKFNAAESLKKQDLLEKRVRFYYADHSNPEYLWQLSSVEFRGKQTKDEFTEYLYKNKYMFKNKAVNYTPELEAITRDKAIVRWWGLGPASTIENIFDQWVYERDNWYLNSLNIKKQGSESKR